MLASICTWPIVRAPQSNPARRKTLSSTYAGRLFVSAGPTSQGLFFRAAVDRTGVRLINVTVSQALSLATLVTQLAPNATNVNGLEDILSIRNTSVVFVPRSNDCESLASGLGSVRGKSPAMLHARFFALLATLLCGLYAVGAWLLCHAGPCFIAALPFIASLPSLRLIASRPLPCCMRAHPSNCARVHFLGAQLPSRTWMGPPSSQVWGSLHA